MLALALASVVVFFAASGSASADSVADFFKGKQVIGYVPGGGYDQYARTLARHLSRPVNPTFVPTNKPGAGSRVAANVG